MPADPRKTAAFALDAKLGTYNGIEVVLQAVVVRASGVLVMLGIAPNESTERQTAEWQAAWAAFTQGVRHAQDHGGDIPSEPLRPWEQLSEIPIRITDDLGTSYRWEGATTHGDLKPWQAIYWFGPPAPSHARELTVVTPDRQGYAQTLLL